MSIKFIIDLLDSEIISIPPIAEPVSYIVKQLATYLFSVSRTNSL